MKVLLIEDEEPASNRLKKLLLAIDSSLEIVGMLVSVKSTVSWLKSNPLPDLILMDIHLSDGSSFEIFKSFEVKCPVIFTTAFDQYALQAFKVNSIDYLLKPIKKDELAQAIEKFNNWFKHDDDHTFDYSRLLSAIEKNKSGFQKRVIIRYGENIKPIEIEDVAYFYTHDKIDYLRTKEKIDYPIDYHLDQLEEILDPKKFFRINRQFIINYVAIQKMVSFSKSRVKLHLKPECELETVVSTERSGNFKEWLIGK